MGVGGSCQGGDRSPVGEVAHRGKQSKALRRNLLSDQGDGRDGGGADGDGASWILARRKETGRTVFVNPGARGGDSLSS